MDINSEKKKSERCKEFTKVIRHFQNSRIVEYLKKHKNNLTILSIVIHCLHLHFTL